MRRHTEIWAPLGSKGWWMQRVSQEVLFELPLPVSLGTMRPPPAVVLPRDLALSAMFPLQERNIEIVRMQPYDLQVWLPILLPVRVQMEEHPHLLESWWRTNFLGTTNRMLLLLVPDWVWLLQYVLFIIGGLLRFLLYYHVQSLLRLSRLAVLWGVRCQNMLNYLSMLLRLLVLVLMLWYLWRQMHWVCRASSHFCLVENSIYLILTHFNAPCDYLCRYLLCCPCDSLWSSGRNFWVHLYLRGNGNRLQLQTCNCGNTAVTFHTNLPDWSWD